MASSQSDNIQIVDPETGIKYIPFQNGWDIVMEKGLRRLFGFIHGDIKLKNKEKLINNESYMEIYTIIYQLCTQKKFLFSKEVHEAFTETSEQFMIEIFNRLNRIENDIDFSKKYIEYFNLFNTVYKKWCNTLFIYVQKFYIKAEKKDNITVQIVRQFKEVVFLPLKDRLFGILRNYINLDRDERYESIETENSLSIKDLTFILKNLSDKDDNSMYKLYFESFLLEFSRIYYAENISIWKNSMGNIQYCNHVHSFKKKENDRITKYLSETSRKTMTDCYIEESVTSMRDKILMHEEEGLSFILNNERWDDLQVFFDILSLVPNNDGIKEFAKYYGKFVQDDVEKKVIEVEQNAEQKNIFNDVSSKFLILYEKYQNMVIVRLSNNSIFVDALRHATKVVINKVYEKFKFYDALPIYLDTILKESGKNELNVKANDGKDIITTVIDKVIEVVSFLSDKDIFMENCRIHLAKRIKQDKVKEESYEQYLVAKIKSEFGMSFTLKMIGILNDIAISKDFCEEFGSSEYNRGTIDFKPSVYTMTHWPPSTVVNIELPSEIKECHENFKNYYDMKAPHRTLIWNTDMGIVNVKTKYPGNKVYEFVLNLVQATIFKKFQGHLNTLSFTELRENTTIQDEYLKRALHSMSCRNIKLLIKSPANDEIRETDTFKFNVKFSCPKRVVNVPCPPFVEINVAKKVIEDRTPYVDAAIVRVMKARRTVGHGQLISEVLSNLVNTFEPEPRDVKKRIEHLIENEYMERSQTDATVYKYLA